MIFSFASYKVIALPTIVVALKGDSDKCTFTLRYRLSRRKRARTIAVAIVGRAIIVWEAIQKRSHEPIYKTYTKIEAKGLRATILLSPSWKSDN